MGVVAHYGCRRIIQVDAAHWWWMRRFPPLYVKRFEHLKKRYINITNYYYYYAFLDIDNQKWNVFFVINMIHNNHIQVLVTHKLGQK